MAYTPTLFSKGDRTKTAHSWADHWNLIADGWAPGGALPPAPPTATNRLAAVEAAAEANELLIEGLTEALGDLDAALAAKASAAVLAALDAKVTAAVTKAEQPKYDPRQLMRGPVTTESVTVSLGIAGDAAFNEQYQVTSNTLPAIWPVDAFGKFTVGSNIWSAKTSNTGLATVTTYRMSTDADAISIFTYAALGFQMSVFVDGRPLAGNPYTPAVTTGFSPFGFQKIDFGTAKPEGRLIEIRMIGGLQGIYVKKPYRVWKPTPDRNPKIAVVGDSFVAPTVMNDASAGNVTTGGYDAGVYQQMTENLGITSLVTDGIGGTGYIAPSASQRPYPHADRLQWLADIQPDVIIVHGGGANDLYTGNSVAATITAAVSYFTTLRAAHPNAKLVFVEGFAPPLFTPGTFNPNYKAIREGVQAALNAAGIKVYYLDIATTRPPLEGTGYVTAPVGTTNSNIYVGSDAVHLTAKGNKYVRAVLAPKIARVLADDGKLAGSLIL